MTSNGCVCCFTCSDTHSFLADSENQKYRRKLPWVLVCSSSFLQQISSRLMGLLCSYFEHVVIYLMLPIRFIIYPFSHPYSIFVTTRVSIFISIINVYPGFYWYFESYMSKPEQMFFVYISSTDAMPEKVLNVSFTE